MQLRTQILAIAALAVFVLSACSPRQQNSRTPHPDMHVGVPVKTVATVHRAVRAAQEDSDKKIEEVIEALNEPSGHDSKGRLIQIYLGELSIQDSSKESTFDFKKIVIKYRAKAMLKGKSADIELYGSVNDDGIAELFPLNKQVNPEFRGHLVCISQSKEAGKYGCDRFYIDIYARTDDGKIYKEQESYPKLNTNAANGEVKKPELDTLGEIPEESEDEAPTDNEEDVEHQEADDSAPFDPHDFQGFPPKTVNELFEKKTPPEWLVPMTEKQKEEARKEEGKNKPTAKPSPAANSKPPVKPSPTAAPKPTVKPVTAKPQSGVTPKTSPTAKPIAKPTAKPVNTGNSPSLIPPAAAATTVKKPTPNPSPAAAGKPPVTPAKSPTAATGNGSSGGGPQKRKPTPAPTAKPVSKPSASPSPAPVKDKKEDTKTNSNSNATIVDLKVPLAIAGKSQAIGYPAAGSLENASKLDLESTSYHVKRPEQKQYYGTKLLVEFLKRMGNLVLKYLPAYKILIGDLTDINGGRQIAAGRMEHSSHQNGLDADLNYLTIAHAPGVSLVGKRGAFLRSRLHDDAQWDLFKELSNSGLVSRIFVNRSVKIGFCKLAQEKGEYASNKSALKQLMIESGHDMHFHLRLRCPADSPRCLKEGPIAQGGRDRSTGCG